MTNEQRTANNEIICPHCGNPIYDDDALLCLYCGEELGRQIGFLSKFSGPSPKIILLIVIALILFSFVAYILP